MTGVERAHGRDQGERGAILPPSGGEPAQVGNGTDDLGMVPHGGYRMKEYLKGVVASMGYVVEDCGAFDERSVDYPDLAEKVAAAVSCGQAFAGVMVDGAGIGSAMVANKVPGIRAALCYDRASARNSREHNHANLLTLGGRMLTETQAEEVVRTWFATPWGGGRHQSRIDKISAVETKNFKGSRG